MQNTIEGPTRLTPLYALISRIRLSSPMNVVESAEQVAKTILATYSAPNLVARRFGRALPKGTTLCVNSVTSAGVNSNH